MTSSADYWDTADDMVAERLLAATTDPVLHRTTPIALSAECPRWRAEQAVLTVVVLALDTPTTLSLDGRARGLDVAERVLCRILDRWADPPGEVVGLGEAAVAWLALTTHDEARDIRDRLPELRAAGDDGGIGRAALVSAAQGHSRDSAEVVSRAVDRLVVPQGLVPGQGPWSATRATQRTLWDARTGAAFAHQVRLHSPDIDPAHAQRAEGLQSVTRPPLFVDRSVATQEALVRAGDIDRVDAPVVWDASAVLSATGPARAQLLQALLDHCPPHVWVGLPAWYLAADDVLDVLRTLRARGHHTVLTGYGAGREPLTALDELPVDAVVMDPHLERGARDGVEDQAAHAVLVEHAVRHGVQPLSTSHTAADLLRHPGPVPHPRTTEPPHRLLERARLVGLTPQETALMVNASHAHDPLAPRWDRYDVAMHWVRESV